MIIASTQIGLSIFKTNTNVDIKNLNQQEPQIENQSVKVSDLAVEDALPNVINNSPWTMLLQFKKLKLC